jgi:hypothetical protein
MTLTYDEYREKMKDVAIKLSTLSRYVGRRDSEDLLLEFVSDLIVEAQKIYAEYIKGK